MFIELTDHLRCPAEHEESFLVLLPDLMEGRSVRTGQLGCPVCARTYPVVDGVFEGGEPPQFHTEAASALNGEAIAALTGVGGPGGYLALVGSPASAWPEVAEQLPGVALVAVNPGPDVTDSAGISVIRGPRIPIKSRSMRGAVLGNSYADDPFWVAEAIRVVLPGLRVVGEGKEAPSEAIDLMASAGGVWVGTPRR
jgi:hypothetical protein